MASIPEPLAARFELLQHLDAAYDLLDNLQSTGKNTALEEAFLTQRINAIEDELAESEAEAEKILDQLKSDPVAWTVARLRFMQGYSWKHAAARVGVSEEGVKARTYRALSKAVESGRERKKK